MGTTEPRIKCHYCYNGAVVVDADGNPWCGSPHVWTVGMGVTRNDPCPCGSPKKFKRCCLANDRRYVRSCRSCGCTDAHACVREHEGRVVVRCHWVAQNLCSACSSTGLTALPGSGNPDVLDAAAILQRDIDHGRARL